MSKAGVIGAVGSVVGGAADVKGYLDEKKEGQADAQTPQAQGGQLPGDFGATLPSK